MRVHYIQHVPFEGLGTIKQYLDEKKHIVSSTKLFSADNYPSIDEFDWLIILGGPMGVYGEDKYNWLAAEKHLIKQAIKSGKIVLGICLGAQLIAEALGAKVYKNTHREIGWYPVMRNSEITNTGFESIFPEIFTPFHWHGDTFDLPEGAILLASSKVCKHQAFFSDNRALGLQFHLEVDFNAVKRVIVNSKTELSDETPLIQNEKEMLYIAANFTEANRIMKNVLQLLEKNYRATSEIKTHL